MGLGHEDLAGVEGRVAQQHVVEPHVHAAGAVGGELERGAGDARGAQVLDALHHVGREQLEAALDEHLLHEGVAHLNGGALGWHAALEGLGGQDGRPADAVAARARAEQHHLVAHALGAGQVNVLVLHDAHAQGVDQGVSLVTGVEHGAAADVRQAERVAVAAHARDHAVHHARRVGVVDVAKAQLVHDGHGPRAHREDVAHDAAHAGRGALVRLHVATGGCGTRP